MTNSTWISRGKCSSYSFQVYAVLSTLNWIMPLKCEIFLFLSNIDYDNKYREAVISAFQIVSDELIKNSVCD